MKNSLYRLVVMTVVSVGLVAGAFAADPAFPKITDGLVLDLDASDLATLTKDEAGTVTSWRSKVGAMEFRSAKEISDSYDKPPCYNAEAFGGRGAVRCGANLNNEAADTYLFATAPQPTPVKTHMLMLNHSVKCPANIGYAYGYSNYGVDGSTAVTGIGVFGDFGGDYPKASLSGFRVSYSPDMDLFANGGPVMLRKGPAISTAGSKVFGWFPLKSNQLLSVLLSDAAAGGAARLKGRQTIGTYYFAQYTTRNMPLDYAQVLNWSRELTEPERLYMECWMAAKWSDDLTVTEWTGAGDGETWGEPENWKDGLVPGPSDVAVIIGPAKSVKVLSDASVSVLVLREVSSVEVAAGVSLGVEKLVSVYGETVFSVAKGGRLTHAFVHKWPETVVSFALADATLKVATPSHGPCYNSVKHNNKTVGEWMVRAWPLEAQPHECLPGAVTGSGTLVFCGTGVQALDASFAVSDGLAVQVESGVLDLNGRSLSVSTLGGLGLITNSSPTAVTLTVDADGVAEATPVLCGGCGINLVVKGGEVAFGGCQPTFDGKVSVGAGTAVVKEALEPCAAMGGVTWHLDASRTETLVTNTNGRLACMYSCTPERGRFIPLDGTLLMPKYMPTAFGGKPALGFGVNDAGVYKTGDSYCTAIQQDIVCSNLTLAVVILPNKVMDSAQTKYLIGRGNVGSDDYRRVVGDNNWIGIGFTDPNQSYLPSNYVAHASVPQQIMYRNGVCLYDSAAGKTDPVPVLRDVRQVFIASVADGADLSKLTYNPCVGTTYGMTGRAYIGLVAEAMSFDRALTHAEIKELSAFLMRKWGIDSEEGAELASAEAKLPKATLSLEGGSVDLGGMTGLVATVTATTTGEIGNGTIMPETLAVSVGADGKLPTIVGDADWALNEMGVTFTGGLARNGNLVKTEGVVSGTLGTVTPEKLRSGLKIDEHSLRCSGGGLMILLK